MPLTRAQKDTVHEYCKNRDKRKIRIENRKLDKRESYDSFTRRSTLKHKCFEDIEYNERRNKDA